VPSSAASQRCAPPAYHWACVSTAVRRRAIQLAALASVLIVTLWLVNRWWRSGNGAEAQQASERAHDELALIRPIRVADQHCGHASARGALQGSS
jgi:hypothetical protein